MTKSKFAVEIWQFSQPVTIGVRSKNQFSAEILAIKRARERGLIISLRAKPLSRVIVRSAF